MRIIGAVPADPRRLTFEGDPVNAWVFAANATMSESPAWGFPTASDAGVVLDPPMKLDAPSATVP